jgi:FkbM family methyltransferase
MNRYIDIPGNGLGAHIVSQLVTSGFCHNFNFNHVYKPMPSIHHVPKDNTPKQYNKRVESMFGFDKLNKYNESDCEIQYTQELYTNKYYINSSDKLKSLYNPINKTSYEWVIHIRRNDVSENQNNDRFISIEKYSEIIDKIQSFYKGTIHIYTDGTPEDLKELTQEHLIIICKSDPLEAFAIMSHAKNLVIGYSSFSYSAAVYNKNHVYCDLIQEGYFHPVLDHWRTIKPHCKIDIGMSKEGIQPATWFRQEPNLFVYGFEPHPNNLKRLYACDCYVSDKRSLVPEMHNRLEIIPMALANVSEKTTMDFHIPNLDDGCSSLLKAHPDNKMYNGVKDVIKVNVISLAMFFETFDFKKFPYIDYIKLDAQGLDLDIVKSGIETIKNRVVWLTMEPDGGYYDESAIDPQNRCIRENLIRYMNDNDFVLFNHPNTSDPTFYNRKFSDIKDDIFIFQH